MHFSTLTLYLFHLIPFPIFTINIKAPIIIMLKFCINFERIVHCLCNQGHGKFLCSVVRNI